MKLSKAGLALVKSSEGVRLTTYLCPAGVPTIGYGSTGPKVVPGLKISLEQAEALLREDLQRFEAAVNRLALPASQGQYDALVSLAFNIGLAAFERSTLLRLHREGAHQAAADQFLRWNKAKGRVLPGLAQRRAAERRLYLS